jgi:hypothetical protein
MQVVRREVFSFLLPRSRHPQSHTSYTGRVERGRMIAEVGRVPFAGFIIPSPHIGGFGANLSIVLFSEGDIC